MGQKDVLLCAGKYETLHLRPRRAPFMTGYSVPPLYQISGRKTDKSKASDFRRKYSK
jgi:hypothetical protein